MATCAGGVPTDYVQTNWGDAPGNTRGRVTSRNIRGSASSAIGYSYDLLGRITGMTFPGGGYFDAAITYAYDNLGNTLSAIDANNHKVLHTYDALGRVITEGDAISSHTYGYDLANRRRTLTWSDGVQITYQFDALGEVTGIADTTSGSISLATLGYDNLGRRVSLNRGNGVNTSYGYDDASRLTTLTNDLPGTASDQTLTFTYNAAGQIKTRVSSNDAYGWAAAVATNRSYTANALNQYGAISSITPTYDAKGNLTGAGSVTFSYSTKNELIGESGGGKRFYYDPAGRMDSILQPASASMLSGFQYAGPQITNELSSTSTISRRYVYGPGGDEPIVWFEGSGHGNAERRYLTSDERGSVVSVTDNSGVLIGINSYDEHGIPAATNIGRFQYTGQAWMPELGMYSYKARIYSPTLGRFMQTDPAGYVNGPNWYGYAGGDPVNNKDPDGLYQVPNEGRQIKVGCQWSDIDCMSSLDNYGSGPGLAGLGDVIVNGRNDDLITRGRNIGEIESFMGQFDFQQSGSNGSPAVGGGRAVQSTPRAPRGLNAYERRILSCNGVDSKTMDGVTIIGFLPPFAYLDSQTDGQTLPSDGGAGIFLRGGNASGQSSLSQMGLIAHEMSHAVGYTHGVSLVHILGEYRKFGYSSSPVEVNARAFSNQVTNSIMSGRCK